MALFFQKRRRARHRTFGPGLRLGLAACLAFGLSFLPGCRLLPREEVEDLPALIQPPEEELVTHVLAVGYIAEEIPAFARVGSAREEALYFTVPGRLRQVDVKYGDLVKKGQQLAVLETGELEFLLRQAQAALEQEQLRYDRQFGEDSEAARTLAMAEMDLKRARLELEMARERLRAAGPTATEQQKKEMQRAVELAQLAADRARLAYEQALESCGPGSAARRIAYLDVERARIDYERLKNQMDRSILRSPMDGKIIVWQAVRGRNVEAFALMGAVADMRGLEMIATIDTAKAGRLRPGMGVRVKMDEGPPRTGRIVRIEKPETNPDGQEWLAHIRMDDARFPLRLDDFYSVFFVLRAADRALLAPNDAVREDVNGRKYLRVIEGKRRRDVYIKTGIESETHTQILEGATAGMVVIGK
ncbi:MAG: efflux RND transporter periplasmic adaptor subunit [Patescibacteria group bacterium]